MKVPEQYRVKQGPMGSDASFGNNGYFEIPHKGYDLIVIASDGMDWDHVSVSLKGNINRTPTWKQMCFIKDLFFDADECVVQYHPPATEYVNNHNGCLHLWKSQKYAFPVPDISMV
jgi:hypothetical protein